jgi:parvulin-like peptidyl-prolyl isomerase
MRIFPLILLLPLLAACSATPAVETLTPPGLPTATDSAPPAEPTATTESVPLALTVNGEGLPLDEFNAELERYRQAQTALGLDINDTDARQTVIDDLVTQILLAQAARESGFNLDAPALQERIDDLTAQLGGADALSAWQQANGYDETGFRSALKRSVESTHMRDQVLASVPPTTEQVHIRQILTYNEEDAQSAQASLNAGTEFEALAARYDPTTRGDIGWLPRGFIDLPAIEEAAFSLEIGAVSPIIETEIGFHIIQVIERDPARPLAFDALLSLQAKALADWVETRRAESEIVILIP